MSIEEARDLSTEHVAALKNIAIEAADADVVKEIAAEEGGVKKSFLIVVGGGADGIFSELFLLLPLSLRFFWGVMLPLSL